MKFDQIYHYRLYLWLFARKDNILFQRQHTHSTRFRDDLLAPYHRLSQGQHSTFYQAITYWNTLPINIRRSPRLVSFRNSKLLLLPSLCIVVVRGMHEWKAKLLVDTAKSRGWPNPHSNYSFPLLLPCNFHVVNSIPFLLLLQKKEREKMGC